MAKKITDKLVKGIKSTPHLPETIYRSALSRVRGTFGLPQGEFVKFIGSGAKDVYNTSGPFSVGNHEYIAARVESRDRQDALTMFFEKIAPNKWKLDPHAPIFELEDPFQTWVDGQLVVGGVKTLRDETGFIYSYFTVFYRGTNVYNLEEFRHGPVGMKDIRLIGLPARDGQTKKVLVFTRPQGGKAGRGKVAVTMLDTLDDLNPDTISNAPFLGILCTEGEWAGVNDLYLLPNGKVGVLYHIARAEGTKRFYNAATFVYDPRNGQITDNKILATREAFPGSPVKVLPDCENKDDLKEVLFPSRIVVNSLNHSRALFYGGLSDTTTGVLRCPNPFWEQYRNSASLVGRLTGGRLDKIL